MEMNVPRTPERNRASERERHRILQEVQMTSPSRRNRRTPYGVSYYPPPSPPPSPSPSPSISSAPLPTPVPASHFFHVPIYSPSTASTSFVGIPPAYNYTPLPVAQNLYHAGPSTSTAHVAAPYEQSTLSAHVQAQYQQPPTLSVPSYVEPTYEGPITLSSHLQARYGPQPIHPAFLTPAQANTRNRTNGYMHAQNHMFQQLSAEQQQSELRQRSLQSEASHQLRRSRRLQERAMVEQAVQARRREEAAVREQNHRRNTEAAQQHAQARQRRQQQQHQRQQHRQQHAELEHVLQAHRAEEAALREHDSEAVQEIAESSHRLQQQNAFWQIQMEEHARQSIQHEEEQRHQRRQQRERDRLCAAEQRRRLLEKRTFLARVPFHDPTNRHSLGLMNVECSDCSALHWDAEKLTTSRVSLPKFGGCCLQGQVKLPPFSQPPAVLRNLLIGKGLSTDPSGEGAATSRHFRDKIRRYNAALAFTSVQVNVDEKVTQSSGPFCFRIFGELRHYLAPLGVVNTGSTSRPSYAQLYIYDPDTAFQFREDRNCNNGPSSDRLRPNVLRELQDMLYNVNPFINTFKQAGEILREKAASEAHDVQVCLQLTEGSDVRRYNLPTVSEVAAIIPGDGTDHRVLPDREVLLRYRYSGGLNTELQQISHLHPNYAPLHYVLMFPYGDKGWDKNTPLVPQSNRRTRSGLLSESLYYAYRLYRRVNEGISSVFLAGKLFHQYIVDGWASIEQSKLSWIHNHQKELRAEVYQGLKDTINSDDHSGDLNDTGRRVILPATHTGSPRHMYQLFQDSMAICRYYRKPDIFLTMTANPNWPEVREAMPKDEHGNPIGSPGDYPDLIARVFELKKQALLKEVKNGIFGRCVANVHTIEFQKRGLPHMHLLIFLAEQDRIRTPAEVDLISCAQIPDPITQPLLYDTVTTTMMHGCNEKCQDSHGKCTKGYPKTFREQTLFSDNGYPELARPDNGRTVIKTIKGQQVVFTNCNVVPYNPYLTAKYNCHINVEICNSVRAIKYIHKYIYKGHDRTTLEFGAQNEVKQYLDARYISAIESCWRIFEFNMHLEEPSVYRLPVHLPDQQVVYYSSSDSAEAILAQAAEKDDRLTSYFKLNQTDSLARTLTYQEIPQHFVWDQKAKKWTARKKGFAIGRMYFAAPSSGERFYLRLLLTVIKGATSFKDLRTVRKGTPNIKVCATFKEACLELGLLDDDQEWKECLREAAIMQSGKQMRGLFVLLLLHCNPAQPGILWNQFRTNICDDLAVKLASKVTIPITENLIYDYGLFLISKGLRDNGRDLSEFLGMPQVIENWDSLISNNYLLEEQLDYDTEALQQEVQTNKSLMNNEQQAIFDAVMSSYQQGAGRVFFLQSAGGCGKTWISNTIASAIRAEHQVVLTVASSGIAALLLHGGLTAHSRFKIPIPILQDSMCLISKGTQLHEVIKMTKLIIWDEVPMQHRFTIEALDRTLQDLMDNNHPFGGITMLFSGDFRQTLPVIPKGTKHEIVNACFRHSPLWLSVEIFHLTQNRRLIDEPNNTEFAKWLLDVGSGRNLNSDGTVTLPPFMRCGTTVLDLINHSYPSIHISQPPQYFLERSILSCRNEDVDDLNEVILHKFPGEERVYQSADTVITEEGADAPHQQPYPAEFLQSLNASGLPLSKLALKKGCPLILLRNLNVKKGLCNGTRLLLLDMTNRLLRCRILGGTRAGKEVFIPRITLEPSNEVIPIKFQRRQFPVRLAFCMTINKSQGQSLHFVGLDLRTPVFSHGQLYVALSRCTSAANIKVLFPEDEIENRTLNVVYPEVLQGLI